VINRIWQTLSENFGKKPQTSEILQRIRSIIVENQSIALMSKTPAWQDYRKAILTATHQIENEVLALCNDPGKNNWEIRERMATRRAMIGLLALPETTDRLFSDKIKELENETRIIRETTEQSPLNLFFWKQPTQ
jgi:hypothetical protein